jgi:cysteine synthase A
MLQRELPAHRNHGLSGRQSRRIFIKGEFPGGCTDLFDGCKDGSPLQQLDALEISGNAEVTTNTYSFLPGWLHPR